MNKPQFYSVSENSLTVSFGNEISLKMNQNVINLAASIERQPLTGLIEIVPAYSSLTVFYDVLKVRKSHPDSPTAVVAVKKYLENAAENLSPKTERTTREIEIIFDPSDEYALDLDFISQSKNLAKSDIIEIFTSKIYRVFMLGFLPGFAYMGEVDERIVVPRKDAPRLKVPKGSVGIAGNQTGIYPLESPGGWQIIGKTETELFTPVAEHPAFLQPGDLVKFTTK